MHVTLSFKLHGKVLLLRGYNAGESVVDAAKSEEVNLIVLGSRGLGTLRRTILGSVSDYVVHHSHCPVVICRHEDIQPPHSKAV